MRGFELYVSIDTMKRLRALAELQNLASPDAAAEMILTEALKKWPEIDELLTEQRKTAAAIREKWAALNKRASSVSQEKT